MLPAQLSQTPNDISEIEKVELENIYGGLDRVESRRAQLGIFFGTGNVTVLAVAFQQQKAALVLIAIIFNILFIMAETTAQTELAAFYFAGYLIERKYLKGDFVHTHISNSNRSSYISS